MLDINKWLGLFSFTVKVGKQNNESFLGACDAPGACTIDALSAGGKLPFVASPACPTAC